MSHTSAEMYELKQKVEELKKFRGRATELVSLYIPAGYDLNKVMQQLREEIAQLRQEVIQLRQEVSKNLRWTVGVVVVVWGSTVLPVLLRLAGVI